MPTESLDNLNPAQFPQFNPGPGRYHTYALAAAYALRMASGFRPALYAVPDTSNAEVAGSSPFEGRISVPPSSYLWAIAATSSETDGFDLQLRDNRNKREMFGKRTFYQNTSGQGSSAGIAHPLFMLPRPRLVLAPGELTVQIFNRSASQNTVQVVLYFVQPEDDAQ
jgi:hypothetical protein